MVAAGEAAMKHILTFISRRFVMQCKTHRKQESLANAKGSARQPWYIGKSAPT